VTLADGTILAEGRIASQTKPASVACEVTETGPVFARARIRLRQRGAFLAQFVQIAVFRPVTAVADGNLAGFDHPAHGVALAGIASQW